MTSTSLKEPARPLPRLRYLVLGLLAIAAPAAIIALISGPAILYTIAHH